MKDHKEVVRRIMIMYENYYEVLPDYIKQIEKESVYKGFIFGAICSFVLCLLIISFII